MLWILLSLSSNILVHYNSIKTRDPSFFQSLQVTSSLAVRKGCALVSYTIRRSTSSVSISVSVTDSCFVFCIFNRFQVREKIIVTLKMRSRFVCTMVSVGYQGLYNCMISSNFMLEELFTLTYKTNRLHFAARVYFNSTQKTL